MKEMEPNVNNLPPKSFQENMKSSNTKENSVLQNVIVHYMLSFKHVCLITVLCPFAALLICFITANIYQPDEVHETHCKVYNIIPSISAITGVKPQTYLWRISIAFHVGPRLIIAAVHRAYHINLINPKASVQQHYTARRWLNIAFYLNIIEVGSLCGVTYISNVENYFIHEKLFIVFMVSSLLHMLACIRSIKLVAETSDGLETVRKGLTVKKRLFVASLVFTAGMIGFFIEHRTLCNNMAFSKFALCEYVVALANMAFHVTVILDFPTEHLVVARGLKYMSPPVEGKLD